MTNIESLYQYTTTQYEAVQHFLAMGVGAHFGCLLFFILIARFVAPRYRSATALSCLVMVSAGSILYGQSTLWREAFSFSESTGLYAAGDHTFSNGFRYVNWMVTIPALLAQLLIVLNIRGTKLYRDATVLILAAWVMIITGYIGQLYETTDISKLLLWGAISTLPFILMNWIVGQNIFRGAVAMPPRAARAMRGVFWLMMFAWTLYPLAYLVPWVEASATGVVWRQGLFTVADVSSKAVYGIVIAYIAVHRSAAEGFQPAMQVLDMAPPSSSV